MLARMSLRVAAVLMALPVLAGASTEDAAAAAPAAETPLGVAQRFAELVRDGEAGTAVDRFYDLDIMLESVFGEDLQRHSRAERTEMKRLLRDTIQRINGDPRITKALQQTTLEGFRSKEKEGEPRTATVNYSVVYGKRRILNTLLLQQSGDRWVIVDGGAVGKMLVPAMRGDYTRRRTHYTPLEFIRAMVRVK
jgi:hypothetical protein